MTDEATIPIAEPRDVVLARQKGRELAAAAGFGATDQTLLVTAIAEVARNIVAHAKTGEVLVRVVDEGARRGLLVVASDRGPGIADATLAMRDGASTAKGLGIGLPGAKRLVDVLTLESALGRGTTVTMRTWAR